MRIVLIAIIVLVVGGLIIANSLSTDFKNPQSSWLFTKTFFKWTGHLVANIKGLFGHASSMTWTPNASNNTNGTNTTNVTD